MVLCEEDFLKLKELVPLSGGKWEEMSLAQEIARAIVVKNEAFPPSTIRIGSKVIVEDAETGKLHEFTIVMPPAADINKKLVSILSPMAAAIIGFRKGEDVTWKMPSGIKHLKIIEVESPLFAV